MPPATQVDPMKRRKSNNYHMYTKAGNAAVAKAVNEAIAALARVADKHAEVGDTLVRDVICQHINRGLIEAING